MIPIMEPKTCSQCGEKKSLSEFYKDRTKKDGHAYMCKECKKSSCKAYRDSHKEEAAAYRKAHKKERAAYDAARLAEHREELTAQKLAHYYAHREKYNARAAARRVTHKEEISAYRATYHIAHKEERKADKHNRRVAGGYTITADDIRYIKEQAGGFCCWCNKPIKEGHGHIDHIQPVSHDGTNELRNLVYICDECNLSKGTKKVLEFLLYKFALATFIV